MTWYDGGKKPPAELFDSETSQQDRRAADRRQGQAVRAPATTARSGYKLLGGATDIKVEFEQSPGHFTEFANAIKGGPPARSNFPDYAGPLTETILLGNLAVWAAADAGSPGKKIEWDAKNLKATNAPEVDGVVTPTYREGYKL